ncbi:MAG: nuclear transport factor 2 family protein [Acidimicrobiales bacterium]
MRELDAEATAAVVALQRLQAAYADAVTRRDWEAVRLLFEADAVVRIDTRTRAPFDLDGPDAVVEFIEGAIRRFTFFELTIVNATVDVDGDEGSGRLYICELRTDDEGRWSEAYGLYRDTYRRRDGVWRIAGRRYSSLARRGPDGVEGFPLPTN